MKKIFLGVVFFIMFIGIMGSIGDDTNNKNDTSIESTSIKQDITSNIEEETEKPTDPIELETYEFSNGNYISGKDFNSGTYDIIAIEGGGNVHSDNSFSGGINAIMGIADDGFYQKEYKNISLPDGTVLTIKDVTIELIQKDR